MLGDIKIIIALSAFDIFWFIFSLNEDSKKVEQLIN